MTQNVWETSREPETQIISCATQTTQSRAGQSVEDGVNGHLRPVI